MVLILVVLLLPAAGTVLAEIVGVDGVLRATAAMPQAVTAVSEIAAGVRAHIANSGANLWIVAILVTFRLVALVVDCRTLSRTDA